MGASVIAISLFVYFTVTGIVEGSAQKDITINQNDYHIARWFQTTCVVFSCIFLAHALWGITVLSFIAGDAWYNRVLWKTAQNNWDADGIDRTQPLPWWAWIHYNAREDWIRASFFYGLLVGVCL